MDKDNSGGVNARELWTWLRFEITQLLEEEQEQAQKRDQQPQPALLIRASDLVSARERAARELLKQRRRKDG